MRNYKKKPIKFIAWDGEGVTVNGESRYVLFRNSEGTCIKNSEGLSTASCLCFILETSSGLSQSNQNVHVIFGGGYDVNMLLCDLSRKDIWHLWQYGWVRWREYKIEYINRKSFTVSLRNVETNKIRRNEIQHTSNRKKYSSRCDSRSFGNTKTVTLWDVFGFFQSTFVDALQKYVPDYDVEKLQSIIQHKKQRADFSLEQFEEIDEYCKLEVDALVQIMQAVQKSMETVNISVGRWDGAGAVAQALLKKYRVKENMRDFSRENSIVHKEAWRAYAGGRIECVQYGCTDETVWHGDINSAYPSACLSLPSFADGIWQHVSGFIPGSFGLYKLKFNFTDYKDYPFYPFFYRDVQGTICYPIYGEGTYWQPEVEAALKWMPLGVEIVEGWIWIQEKQSVQTQDMNYPTKTCADHVAPFDFVETIYKQRLEYKKQKNAAQMILKLGMNSLYGKLAQQIGYKKNEKPAYQQIEWAGYITSKTRATLFDIAMQHPDNVVMFATDGLFSTEKHRVQEGNQLGEWEVHTHDKMVVAQSGVYWYYDKDTASWTDKFRGFDREDLTWEKVLESFQQLRWHLTVRSRRFQTMGGALRSSVQWKKWRTWPENLRTLLLIAQGTKRTDISPFWTPGDNPSHRLFQTRPLLNETALCGVPSQLYKKTEKMLTAKRLEQEEQDGFI